MYELRTKLPKFTHEFLDRNFPLRRPRISSRAVDAVKSSWNNSIHTQTLFIYLFNRLTFSVSSTRPEAGDAAERDGAQNPPLVGWSHAAADQGGWSALNVKSGGELHQVVGLKWSVWVCMSVCVCLCVLVCVWVGAYFRLITLCQPAGSVEVSFSVISWRDASIHSK